MSFDGSSYTDDHRPVNHPHNKFVPLGKRILIEKVLEAASGKIILPDGFNNTTDSWYGVVKRVGNRANWELIGKKVVVSKHYCRQLSFTDGEFYLMEQDHILAEIG